MDPSSASTSFHPYPHTTPYQQCLDGDEVLDYRGVTETQSSSWNLSRQKKPRPGKDVLESDGGNESSQAGTIGATNMNLQPKNHGKDIMNDLMEDDHVGSNADHAFANGSPLDDIDDVLDDEYDYCLEEESDYEYNFAEKDCPYSEPVSSGNLQFGDLDPVSLEVKECVPVLQNSMLNNKTYHYNRFKNFDIISDDLSDHFFIKEGLYDAKSTPKGLAKKIQHEWNVLENHLPETIFVIASEKRIDLLRAVMVGPSGTPYHDGLFFFDILFPREYPNVPPNVNFHAGGERLNPNLYECGRVCLSLLNTWHGSGCEKWKPDVSTILQVLVSIQALILNAKPFFNEPSYETLTGIPQWEEESLAYNEEAFLLSCKAMVSLMWTPPQPQCIKEFVDAHFRVRGHDILTTCLAYINGVEVGSYDGKEIEDLDLYGQGSSRFIIRLRDVFEQLLMGFSVKGADCAKFFAMKLKKHRESKVCADIDSHGECAHDS